jgi:phage head maturation protease
MKILRALINYFLVRFHEFADESNFRPAHRAPMKRATPLVVARECRKAAAPDRERRMIAGRVETRALTDAEKSAGYIGVLVGVIPLNTDSVVLRDRRLNNGQPFVERIAPKAFDGATDVMGMAGHTEDTLAAFARQGANLTIAESATEIRWEALLPNTTASRDLLELGEKKIIRGTSFEFDLGAEDAWEKRSDGTAVRTVKRGKLATVNPVVWPAYDDSSLTVEARQRGTEHEQRGGYYAMLNGDGCYCYGDPTLTADTAFAQNRLWTAVSELTDANEYLRAAPAGGMAEYAKAKVASAAAEITTLADWLAANGATVNPELAKRAAEIREARSKAGTENTFPARSLWAARTGLR